MAQSTPILPQAGTADRPETSWTHRLRQGSRALVDVLARHPRVTVLSDYRHTTGCLIIACPFASRTETEHRCAVIGSATGGADSISCINPSCWHRTAEDFLARLSLARLTHDDEHRKEERLRVILAVLNHDVRPVDSDPAPNRAS